MAVPVNFVRADPAARLREARCPAGRGANLLLNIPPDRRGLIPATDAARLTEFGRRIRATYGIDLARRATARATNVRGRSDRFGAARAIDGDASTFWATDDRVTAGSLELEWASPVRFDRVVLQEAIALGQRVEAWTIEAEADGRWTRIAEGTTIGYKRIARFEGVTTTRIRISIVKALACPTLTTVRVYLSR